MVSMSLLCFAVLLQRRFHLSNGQNTKCHATTATAFVNAVFPRAFGVAHGSNLRLRMTASVSDLLPAIRKGVAEAGGEGAWVESVDVLSDLLISEAEEAEMLLSSALGWKGWAQASESIRRYQNPLAPDATTLQQALTWLQEGPLELNPEQLRKAIRDSPKVYLVTPDETYKKALKAAPKEYRDPEAFKQILLEDPLVLQCTYNCSEEGCCQNECGSCWVSHQRR